MIILESVTILVLEQHARHVTLSKRIVVAVGSQFATIQSLEIVLFTIDLFQQSVASIAFVACLTVLHRVIVADHVDVGDYT